MTDGLERPAKPPPLDVTSEDSKAAWRAYLRACALADNPGFRAGDAIRKIVEARRSDA